MVSSLPNGFGWCPNGNLMSIGSVCDCSECSPKKEPVVFDFNKLPHVELCCPVDGCAELLLLETKKATMYWECTECSWEIHSTFDFVERKGSPSPVPRRCRLCDIEINVRKGRRSWACMCGFTTKASDSPFESTGPDHGDGVWCGQTLLSNRQWRKQYWIRIPKQRQEEILDNVNVSDAYYENLSPTLDYIKSFALNY